MRKKLRRFTRSPDCREVAAVLQSYLDGELPMSQIHLVAEHLEHCHRCGIEASVYHEIKRSLERLATPPDREAVQRLHGFVDDLTAGDTR